MSATGLNVGEAARIMSCASKHAALGREIAKAGKTIAARGGPSPFAALCQERKA